MMSESYFKVEASEYVLQEDEQLHQVNRLAGENNVSVLEQIQSVEFLAVVIIIINQFYFKEKTR
jgi:hypothetical protein